MTEQEMIDRIADVLDADAGSIVSDTRLDEIGWDSMGMLSVIALAKTNGKTITGAQIREFETVGDILNAAF
ncbi:MAG: acyl carrier protein [Kiritimatiellae bacterium]|nr:acyl carrier protein [Kiritimatiellia bacterium]